MAEAAGALGGLHQLRIFIQARVIFMRKTKHMNMVVAALLPALVVFTAAGLLHHGWSNYDQDIPMNLTGTILEFTYENPHGMMELEVEEDSVWTVVLAPATRMQQRGLAESMLEVGGAAEILAYPHKQGKVEMRAEWISIDGDTTQLR